MIYPLNLYQEMGWQSVALNQPTVYTYVSKKSPNTSLVGKMILTGDTAILWIEGPQGCLKSHILKDPHPDRLTALVAGHYEGILEGSNSPEIRELRKPYLTSSPAINGGDSLIIKTLA